MNHIKYIFLLLIGLLSSTVVSAQSATLIPITWNVVGLDSNNVTVGPNVFPVGARVCNTGTTALTGYRTRFVWETTSTFITRTSPEFLDVPSLAPGACQDLFNEVTVTRNSAAYDQRARYRIDLRNNLGNVVLSTPTPREIYVERLISQNRNAVTAIKVNGTAVTLGTGSVLVNEGQTYTIQMEGRTATQGYEQLEQFLNLSSALFTVKSVKSTYSAAAGTDPLASTKLYADGCGWVNDPTDITAPSYRECPATGKYGGTTSVTYVVQVKSGAAAARPAGERVAALLYDFSGSSYHYNSDYSDGVTFNFTTTQPPAEADLAISKVGALASPGNGSFTLSVTNLSAIAATTVVVTDNVPNGYNIKNNQAAAPAGTTLTFVRTNPESVRWEIPTIAAGQTLSYTFDVQTVNSQSDYLNRACVAGAQTDPNLDNNCANAQVPVDLADLAITKTTSFTSPLKIGDGLTFSVSVANLGGSAATGVVVSDTVPAGYSVTSATCATGWTANHSAPIYRCSANANLAVNTTPAVVLTIAATALAPTDPTVLTAYLNSASATSTSNDPNTDNNTATASQAPTFLTIVKTSNAESYVAPISTGSYTLTVTKNGTSVDLGTITVADVLPAGVTATAIGGDGWLCTLATVSCTRPDNIVGSPPAVLTPTTYPAVTVSVTYSGPSQPVLINRVSVTAERGGVVTSFDETSKTVSWTNNATFFSVVATSNQPDRGSASCDPDSVLSGESSICTATPAPGFRFTGWEGDCSSAAANTSCVLPNITSNKLSQANFVAIDYTVAATVGVSGGGTASCTVLSVASGGGSVCTAMPAPGYRFLRWTGDCAGRTATCALSDINANNASVAEFELAPIQSIPTLSEWAMILMASVMALFGFAAVRRNS